LKAFVLVMGLCASRIGIIGLARNLLAYAFVSQQIYTAL
jgi:hypothetical protein